MLAEVIPLTIIINRKTREPLNRQIKGSKACVTAHSLKESMGKKDHEKKMTWQRKIHENIKEYLTTSSVHGVGKISRAHKLYLKFMWGTVVFGFLIASIITCYRILSQFAAYEAYLVHNHRKIGSLKFPSVTICNANNYQARKIRKYFDHHVFLNRITNQSLKLGMFLPSSIYGAAWAFGSNNITLMKETRSGSEMLFANDLDGWCTFQTFINCTKRDFIDSFYHSYLGMCKTFNSDGKYLQRGAGPLSGLTMKLFINQEDYAPMIPFDMGAGVTLIVHPPNVFPNPLVDAVLLQPGSLTRISIHREVYIRLPSPYPSRCVSNSPIYLLPGHYTSSNCEQSCLQHDMYVNCGVLESVVTFNLKQKGLQIPYKLTKNITQEQIACSLAFYNKALNGTIRCDCPLACEEETLTTKTSSSKWPSKVDMAYYRPVLARMLNKTTVSEEFIQNNMLAVQIFFDSISYEEMIEVPAITEAALFGSLGGAVGLFLGASCYSIVEFVALIIKSIVDCGKMAAGKSSNRVIKLKKESSFY